MVNLELASKSWKQFLQLQLNHITRIWNTWKPVWLKVIHKLNKYFIIQNLHNKLKVHDCMKLISRVFHGCCSLCWATMENSESVLPNWQTFQFEPVMELLRVACFVRLALRDENFEEQDCTGICYQWDLWYSYFHWK